MLRDFSISVLRLKEKDKLNLTCYKPISSFISFVLQLKNFFFSSDIITLENGLKSVTRKFICDCRRHFFYCNKVVKSWNDLLLFVLTPLNIINFKRQLDGEKTCKIIDKHSESDALLRWFEILFGTKRR